MPFITKNKGLLPPPDTSPPMPALQAIFYWLAAATLGFIFFIWSDNEPPIPYKMKVIATVIDILATFLLFSIGQVIGYLGQTAHYARLTYEHATKPKVKEEPIE